jgi:tetratricopeptide (TPR) repeat protein
MKANWLMGRTNFAAAGSICEGLIEADPTDSWAVAMLAHCYEQQDRLLEALRLAEEGIRLDPQSLMSLQIAARLAAALDQHDRATEYLRHALALPEVRDEIPKERAIPKPLLWTLRILARLPVLRRRLSAEPFEIATQRVELQQWKRWAQEYVAWSEAKHRRGGGGVVH